MKSTLSYQTYINKNTHSLNVLQYKYAQVYLIAMTSNCYTILLLVILIIQLINKQIQSIGHNQWIICM